MLKLRSLKTILLLLILLISIQTRAYALPSYIINGVPTEHSDFSENDDCKKIESYNSHYNLYTDFANGYSLIYPRNMAVDVSLSALRTVFSNSNMQIEVYYDDFSTGISNATDYLYYANRFTRNTRDHTVEQDRYIKINGYSTHLLKWERRKLSRLINDMRYYVSAEIVKNDQEVYTILIKSSIPLENEAAIINSFAILARQGKAGIFKRFSPSQTPIDEPTRIFFRKYFSPASSLKWGIFEPCAPDKFKYLDPLEQHLGYSFPILLRYQSLDDPFPAAALQNAKSRDKYIELTLQTVHAEQVNALQSESYNHDNASLMYDILDGKYDAYLQEYAKQIKAYRRPILFRLNNEMNGDWCWYSAYYTSKDSNIYKAVWLYIRSIFVENEVTNVLWVFNPHDVSRPDFAWNHYLMYYPGDEYVDIIGMTGYNTGTYFPGESWREFDEIYQPLYSQYEQYFAKPFMITEFSSNSVGGNKPAWIENMFTVIPKFKKIKVAIWWSGIDYDPDGNPGRIYLINENPAVLAVFRNYLPNYK